MDIKIPGLGNAPATPAPQQQQTPVPQQPLASTPTPPPPANPVGEGLYDPRLEKLIELALVDGELRTSANTAVLGILFHSPSQPFDFRFHSLPHSRIRNYQRHPDPALHPCSLCRGKDQTIVPQLPENSQDIRRQLRLRMSFSL